MYVEVMGDLANLITFIKQDPDYLTNMNLDLKPDMQHKFTNSNGYIVYWVHIEKGDPFMELDHGDRIYTILNPKFKSSDKSFCFPVYRLKTKENSEDKSAPSEVDKYMIDNVYSYLDSDFRVFVGDGYVNIEGCPFCHYENDLDFNFVIVSDRMYGKRNNALKFLLALADKEEAELDKK